MSKPDVRFSSIGSAIASRIPVDAQGNFPINRTLIAVLVFALALFHQALFWLLAVLVQGRGRPIPAGRFLLGSLGLGALLWLMLIILQMRVTRGGSRNDWLVAGLTGGLLATGVVTTSPGCVLAASGLLTAWGARGLLRKNAA